MFLEILKLTLVIFDFQTFDIPYSNLQAIIMSTISEKFDIMKDTFFREQHKEKDVFVKQYNDFISHLDIWNYLINMNLEKFTYKALSQNE